MVQKMQPHTLAIIKRLIDSQWFSNVGHRIADTSIVQVSTWDDAEANFTSADWEGVTLTAHNDRRSAVHALHPHWSAKRWNSIIAEFKAITGPLVHAQVHPLMERFNLPQTFEHCVQWDMLGFVEESEFSAHLAPGFATRLGNFYLAGHFPCGWVGAYPDGKLLVF